MKHMSKINSICMTNPQPAKNKTSARTAYWFSGIVVATALFAGCSLLEQESAEESLPPDVVDVSNVPNASPESLPLSKYGNPTSYVVAGKRYYTMPASTGYMETGLASWYGTDSHGKRTSSGEIYDSYGMTAAHRTLPLPSFVKVTNKQNGRSVIVKVNDRGPFYNNRLIDLSYVAAVKLGIVGYGTGLVEVSSIDPDNYNRDPEQIIREASAAESAPDEVAAMTTGIAESDSGTTEVVATATDTMEPQTDTATSKWKFWQWRPSMPEAKTSMPAEATADTVIAATEPAAETLTTEVFVTETFTADAQPDMEAQPDTVAAQPEATTSKWKFWQWRPSMLKPKPGMPAEAAADTVIVATEPVAETLKTEVIVTETFTADAQPDMDAQPDTAAAQPEATTSKWKFWQWRPSMLKPKTGMPAEATADTDIAATEPAAETLKTEVIVTETYTEDTDIAATASAAETLKTEVIATETFTADAQPDMDAQPDSVDAQPDTTTSKWKFWQWRPSMPEPGTSKPETTMDTVIVTTEPDTGMPEAAATAAAVTAQPAPVTRKTLAMATTSTEPPVVQTDQQDTPSVYLQTGAFRLRENAERLRPDIEAVAPGSFKIVETTGARKLYKIEIGPLRDTEEAMRVSRALKAVGISPKIMDSSAGSTMTGSATTYLTQPAQQMEQVTTQVPAAVVSSPVLHASEPAYATAHDETPIHSPAPAAAARYGSKVLYQQAGAFARSNNAVRLRTRIVDETLEPTEIFKEQTNLEKAGGLILLHKVQVGPLSNKTEAMNVKRSLEPLGVTDSFPVYRYK